LFENINYLIDFENFNKSFLESKDGKLQYEVFKNIMKSVENNN